jgi:CMP-N-acetylneuraminic acid synthetase
MTIYAMIPARSGSKGLPGKNIKEINGHPLLAYSIAFAKKAPFDRILVSTDSAEYRDIALQYGAECPYLRGAEASSDTAMEEMIIADLASNLPRYGISMPDLWARLKPTCPFRSVRSIETAINLLEDESIDSVRIVSEDDARLHTINNEGFLEPLMANWDPNRSTMRRTEFPRAFRPFNLEIFRHSGWQKRGAFYIGRRVKPVIEHNITGLDINGEDDFQLISALITTNPRPTFLRPYVHDPQV